MVSRDDVIYAYRLLLGREPENESVVNHYASELPSIGRLRELSINSSEFREKMAATHIALRPHPHLNRSTMQIEIKVPPEKLALLLAKTSSQWQHLGETEPHWSVLTNENYFQKNFHMKQAEFYASGEKDCEAFEATLARAGVALSGLKTCLELGCGVGRITAPLAARFSKVIAVDISAAHLRVARNHLQERAITNVELRHLDSIDGIRSLGHFDVLYSIIVLQHNPPPIMAHLLLTLLEQLNSGGVALIQIPTYRPGYQFRLDPYLAEESSTQMEIHYLPQAELFQLISEAGCRVLEIREDDALGL
jgi:2-polyprenyl-3-methyl-5-hydroxy-6-metoxy-1,4-benzoquinol methylase